MSFARVIRPATINILGNTQRSANQCTTNQCFEIQEESTRKQSWWGKFKDKAKKAFDKFKEAVTFVKDSIVPIVTAAASFLNAWSYFQHSTRSVRCRACAV